jgi:hypothetical protein
MDLTVMPLRDIPALIEWLNQLYPEKSPNPSDSEREVWMKAGERRAVNVLISKLNATELKET